MKHSISTIISRRSLMQGLMAGIAAGTLVPARELLAEAPPASTLTFDEVASGLDAQHHVAKGYTADILLRWGDPLWSDAPFDVLKQTAALQEKQFGYNCDFIAFMPLPQGSQNSEHGILCVNHEYTLPLLMSPSGTEDTAVEMAAHGMSFVEIKKTKGKWHNVDSRYNRRITATTKMSISGPCAGDARMKTTEDPTGTEVLGTFANCAGGVTPWGTVLTCEENFHNYFGGQVQDGYQAAYAPYSIGGDVERDWWKTHSRFDLGKEPNEPNRFGWVVEIDPYDPASKPVKRTALGRLKHEGASCVVNKDGHVVVYMGDDGKFECVYKFITRDKYDTQNRDANMELLDNGTLYAAQFNEDGKVKWLPLGGADDLLHTRAAAKRAGATPMDRPEDVEPNPANGCIYVMLTNNSARGMFDKDAANPRSKNTGGHIITIIPPDDDHAADHGTWEFFIIAGNPDAQKTSYGPGTSKDGWLACPDNCAFDKQGHIWITTDRSGLQEEYGTSDGLYAADTSGFARAATKLFYRGPVGAEICGPCFTPDNRTLFLAVQHPGEGSSFYNPSTRWPDFKDGMPPRPSVVAISKDDGEVIGS